MEPQMLKTLDSQFQDQGWKILTCGIYFLRCQGSQNSVFKILLTSRIGSAMSRRPMADHYNVANPRF
ncbi:hypothetical protein M8J76_005454 [Diaphorina citri]|nr:hypothetical protein M8J76_005454 [Diaphorina citri]